MRRLNEWNTEELDFWELSELSRGRNGSLDIDLARGDVIVLDASLWSGGTDPLDSCGTFSGKISLAVVDKLVVDDLRFKAFMDFLDFAQLKQSQSELLS